MSAGARSASAASTSRATVGSKTSTGTRQAANDGGPAAEAAPSAATGWLGSSGEPSGPPAVDGRWSVISSSTALRGRSRAREPDSPSASASASASGRAANGCGRGARDGRPRRGGASGGSPESSAQTSGAPYAQVPWTTSIVVHPQGNEASNPAGRLRQSVAKASALAGASPGRRPLTLVHLPDLASATAAGAGAGRDPRRWATGLIWIS